MNDYATKSDLQALRTDIESMFDIFSIKLFRYLDQRFGAVDERFERLESRVDSLEGLVDNYAKRVEIYHQEMLVGHHQLDRVQRWVEQIAQHIGLKLEY